jgi:hypothetical protein
LIPTRQASRAIVRRKNLIGAGGPGADTIHPGSYSLPASFTQGARRYRSRAGLVFDNVALGWRLQGALDVSVLGSSLNEIVRRHEPLRTAVRRIGGEVRQVVSPSPHLQLEFADYSRLSARRRRAVVAEKSREDAALPFHLDAQDPLRATLLRVAAEEQVLLVTVNHACWDGASTNIFLSELEQVYASFQAGRRAPLAEIDVQFGDYITWLGDVYRELSAHSPQASVFPIDNLNGSKAIGNAAGRNLLRRRLPDLAPATARGLQGLAAAGEGTLATLLLTAFAMSLSRLTTRDEVTIAVVVGNRDRSEAKAIIGSLASYVFVSMNIEPGSRSLAQAHDAVRRRYVEAQASRRPLAQLVPHGPAGVCPRDGTDAQSPVFDIIFNFIAESTPVQRQLGSVLLSHFDRPAASALPGDSYWHRSALILNVFRSHGGGLGGHLIHDPAVIDPADAEKLLAVFRRLLDAVPDEQVTGPRGRGASDA